MITKQIIRSVLIIVAFGSVAIWGNKEFKKSTYNTEAQTQSQPVDIFPLVDGPQVVMTYFVIGTRCASCKKIEALALETAEKDFAAELSSKKLIFRIVNTDEPVNQHYLDQYKLTSKTVVISRRVDGKETEWKDMAKVWDLFDDGPAYHKYLGTQIREYLGT